MRSSTATPPLSLRRWLPSFLSLDPPRARVHRHASRSTSLLQPPHSTRHQQHQLEPTAMNQRQRQEEVPAPGFRTCAGCRQLNGFPRTGYFLLSPLFLLSSSTSSLWGRVAGCKKTDELFSMQPCKVELLQSWVESRTRAGTLASVHPYPTVSSVLASKLFPVGTDDGSEAWYYFTYLQSKLEKLDWVTLLGISMRIAYCLEHMHLFKAAVITMILPRRSQILNSQMARWGPSSTNGVFVSSSELENAVHKFGIVLLEILTGRVPFSKEDGSLEQWASRYFNGKTGLAEMTDPSIGSFSEEAARALCEVVRSCFAPDPKRRPAMVEVAAWLGEMMALGPDRGTSKVSPLWLAELEIMSSES